MKRRDHAAVSSIVMARIFVTGSADGLGYATALALLDEGHDVVVHVRSQARLSAVKDLDGARGPRRRGRSRRPGADPCTSPIR
jgi:NAD(P)-dependent dehydrogenase (short-subunit alcohol dehydrogenase family)